VRSSDPHHYAVPNGYIELTRAVEETVKSIFGSEYVLLTKAVLNNRTFLKARDQRWRVVRKLLLRDFRFAKLATYLLSTGVQQAVDPSHWWQQEPSWRPFVRDPLGVPGAPVYLLLQDHLQRWLAAHRCTRRVAVQRDDNSKNEHTKSVRGRPIGTGRYADDPQLVEKAMNMLGRGDATSALMAAEKVAGDPNDAAYSATRDRLRKKIRNEQLKSQTFLPKKRQ
jgi:hypothetical protein